MTWHCGAYKCSTHSSPDHQCPSWQMAAIRVPVGAGGNANSKEDIRIVQGALNRFSASCGGPDPKLDTDGLQTLVLIEAIKVFQRTFFGALKPDGKVDVHGRTNQALARRLNVKRISVDLSAQTVSAVNNGCVVHHLDCVTGDNSNPTLPGVFKISRKDRVHRSSQFNVQMNFAMFFDHGKALHQYHGIVPLGVIRVLKAKAGADFLGSHGCVRMDQADAETLFDFAPLGTRVTVL